MKKRVLFFGVIVLMFVVILFGFFYRNSQIERFKTGYLIYANHSLGTLIAYDMATNIEHQYIIDGYANFQSVKEYIGGDFCCIAEKSETHKKELLFFKDNKIERTIPLIDEVFAVTSNGENHFIETTDGHLYVVDNNQKYSEIDKICSTPYINSKGHIAYLRNNTNKTDNNSISSLCYYKNGDIIKLCDATQIVCWISENELVVSKTETVVTEFDNHTTTEYNTKNYVVNVDTQTVEETPLFEEAVLSANLSQDKSKAVCWFPMDGSTDSMYLGLVNVTDYKVYKRAIGRSSLNSLSPTFLWLDENPLQDFKSNQLGKTIYN